MNIEATKLSAFHLKIIAIVAMAIDHIAWQFVSVESVSGQVMHAIGRLTFPIMAFMLVEGYRHTRNLKRYGLRLFGFAVLSSIPFYLYFGNPFNVLFTLLLGLIVIYSIDKIMAGFSGKQNVLGILLCILVTVAGMSLANSWDWGANGILIIVIFSLSRGNRKRQLQSYGVLAAATIALAFIPGLHSAEYRPLEHSYLVGLLLSIPLLFAYSGERGRDMRWLFYIFYPAHLLVIVFVRSIVA